MQYSPRQCSSNISEKILKIPSHDTAHISRVAAITHATFHSYIDSVSLRLTFNVRKKVERSRSGEGKNPPNATSNFPRVFLPWSERRGFVAQRREEVLFDLRSELIVCAPHFAPLNEIFSLSRGTRSESSWAGK